MATEDLDNIIEDILKKAIERLKDAYDSRKESLSPNFKSNKNGCRLVFPIKRDKQTRVSEQELRFAFVEAFNEYCKESKLPLFYSVETPTRDPYSGFSEGKPQVDPNGQSGNIDLVIYDKNGNRICLIEFKAHNANEKEYLKDFFKLNNPAENDNSNANENAKHYLINILEEVKTRTENTLEEKVENSNKYNTEYFSKKEEEQGKTTFYYINLKENNPQIHILPHSKNESNNN